LRRRRFPASDERHEAIAMVLPRGGVAGRLGSDEGAAGTGLVCKIAAPTRRTDDYVVRRM
jgi:hypothetical protein